MKDVDDLDGYEWGVVARALLERLIKQGRLEERQDQGRPFEIVIPVSHSQLRLLALFSEDGRRHAAEGDPRGREDRPHRMLPAG